jgi:hypothetical protein
LLYAADKSLYAMKRDHNLHLNPARRGASTVTSRTQVQHDLHPLKKIGTYLTLGRNIHELWSSPNAGGAPWGCLWGLSITLRIQLKGPFGGCMPCELCGSVNQSEFSGEIGIHFPGLKNIDKPVVWVFPELVVCFDCGIAEFAVPEAELRLLGKGDAAESA